MIRIWKRHFLLAEFILAVILMGAFVAWVEQCGGVAVVDRVLSGNRSAVYGTLASISGSLLGFVIATISIVIAFSTNERMAIVRRSKQYPTLWKVFVSTIRWLGFATAAALGALLLDRDQAQNHVMMFSTAFGSLLAAFRLARSVWILEEVVGLVTADGSRT